MSTATRTDIESLESRKFRHLEARLLAEFSPPLRPEDVQRCLIDRLATYESARVRAYVPVLVEREVTELLRRMCRSKSA